MHQYLHMDKRVQEKHIQFQEMMTMQNKDFCLDL